MNKILSIDVGMKNLAFCLIDYKDHENYSIDKWDVIDLCENSNEVCMGKKKNGENCNKMAKYTKKNKFYCKNLIDFF